MPPCGGELIGGPFGIFATAGFLEAVVKMVVAFWRADEQSATATIGEGGADALVEGVGIHVGEFVENGEGETAAAEGIGTVGGTEADGGTESGEDGEVGDAGSLRPIGLVIFLRRSQATSLARGRDGATYQMRAPGVWAAMSISVRASWVLPKRRPATRMRKREGSLNTSS